MDFLDLAQSRRSVRRYTAQEVSQEHILTLLQAMQAAPSAGNCQPWHMYVVRDEAVRAHLSEVAWRQTFIQTAPVVFVVCADLERNAQRYGQRGTGLYCIQDTAAAIQNLLLCAKSLGLGACWCGAFDEQAVAETLNTPAHLRPVAIIPIGHTEDMPTGAQSRRPLDDMATFVDSH